MNGKIMVTAGSTEISKQTIEFADKLAVEKKCEMIILHVVERSPYYPSSKSDFDKMVSEITIKARHTIVTPTGYPSVEIVSQINQIKPELVIMAGHDHSIFERVFLGSTVKYVVHHTMVPIYIYKKLPYPDEKSIIVPVDFTRINKTVIQLADNIAQKQGLDLNFVHVNAITGQYSDWGAEAYLASAELERQRAIELIELNQKLDNFIQEFDIQADYKLYVRNGTIYNEILKLQKELKSNLIMLASHSHNIVGRLLLGGNSDYLLNHANCSVYVHQEEFDKNELAKEGKNHETHHLGL